MVAQRLGRLGEHYAIVLSHYRLPFRHARRSFNRPLSGSCPSPRVPRPEGVNVTLATIDTLIDSEPLHIAFALLSRIENRNLGAGQPTKPIGGH